MKVRIAPQLPYALASHAARRVSVPSAQQHVSSCPAEASHAHFAAVRAGIRECFEEEDE